MKYLIALFLSVATLHAAPLWEVDAQVKVLGLVCPSCAIGVKKISPSEHRSVVGDKNGYQKTVYCF